MIRNIQPKLAVAAGICAFAGAAHAQINTSSLNTLNLYTDQLKAQEVRPQALVSSTVGIGYDDFNSAYAPDFTHSPNNQTPQTFFQDLVMPSSVAAGSEFQVGIHAFAGALNAGITKVYVSLFQLSNSTSSVPLGSAVFKDQEIDITNTTNINAAAEKLWYTNVFSLGANLSAGGSYIMAVSPSLPNDNAHASDFVAMSFLKTSSAFSGTSSQGLTSSQQAAFDQQYYTYSGAGSNGGALTDPSQNNLVNTVSGFRFYSQAVPEPTSMAALGIGICGLIARRRRK